MLSCNGEQINLDKDPKDYNASEKQVIEWKKKLIADYGDAPWSVSYKPEMIKEDPDNKGRKTKPGSVDIKCNATIKTKSGMQKWAYFTGTEFDVITKEEVPTPRNISFEGHKDITEYDWELAVYWRFISPLCADNKYEDGKPKSTKTYFIFDNKPLTSRTSLKKAEQESKVLWYITNEASPLNKEMVVTLCHSYSIPFSKKDAMDIDIMKDKLLGVIRLREKTGRKGFEQFLLDVKIDDDVKMRANCDRLMKDFYTANTQKNSIVKRSEPGKNIEVICKYKVTEDAVTTLMNYYKKNTEAYNEALLLLA